MLRDTEWANPCRTSIARSQCDERGSRLSRPSEQSGIATNALKGNLSHGTSFFSTVSNLRNRDRVASSWSEALKTVEVDVLGSVSTNLADIARGWSNPARPKCSFKELRGEPRRYFALSHGGSKRGSARSFRQVVWIGCTRETLEMVTL